MADQVRCWGNGFAGDLGNDTLNTPSHLPVVVLGLFGTPRLSTVTQIGLGENHGCARLASGRARCWGANSFKELGNRQPQTEALRPVPVLAPL